MRSGLGKGLLKMGGDHENTDADEPWNASSSCTCGRLQLKNLFLRSFVLPNTLNAGLGHQVSFKAQTFNFAM